jgi:hypothetical protein
MDFNVKAINEITPSETMRSEIRKTTVILFISGLFTGIGCVFLALSLQF